MPTSPKYLLKPSEIFHWLALRLPARTRLPANGPARGSQLRDSASLDHESPSLPHPPGATHPLDRTTGPRPATPPRIRRRPCAGASLQRAGSSPRRKNGLANATATFRTLSHRERRAVMGLSMGGGQAIRAGLGQHDLSASVGDCSAATIGDFTTRRKALLDDPTGTNAALKRLCIHLSRQDSLSASKVRPTFFREKASTLTSSDAAAWRRPRRGSSAESATVRSCQFPRAGRRSRLP